jgi:hypothetical protein
MIPRWFQFSISGVAFVLSFINEILAYKQGNYWESVIHLGIMFLSACYICHLLKLESWK